MTTGNNSPTDVSGVDLSNRDARVFSFIARIARAEAGLELPETKAPMVFSRLAKRIRSLKLSGPEEYCSLLSSDRGAEEIGELITVLTTNVTSFFREKYHFEYLRNEILPDLCSQALRGGRVRLWSAGCSTGQEAYCLALETLECMPKAAQTDFKILATDIDNSVLAMARAGIYAENIMAGVSKIQLNRYFQPSASEPTGQNAWRAGDALRSIVSFRQLNLVKPWPISGKFQVIFCRNVIIYFGSETQRELAKGFSAHCSAGGHLFLGHSERLENPLALGFHPVGTTTYRKRP